MNSKILIYRLFKNQIRLMSNKKQKNHYDSLGISSSSTQGEVKSAYYKLSMLYHPDKTKNDSQSSQKFRDITEAYEILGNVKTRKLYDRGLYSGGTTTVQDTVSGFHKSRETRARPPAPSGRTPIYDFDEWSKHHYGATFRRQMEGRRKQQMHQMKRREDMLDVKKEKLLLVLGAIFVICMYFFRETNNYDNVTFGEYIPTQKYKKKD